MWRISGNADNRRPLVQVGLLKFLPNPGPLNSGTQPLAMPVVRYRALIDTGAQMTCVTAKAIHENGLICTGRRDVFSGRGESRHKVYDFYLGLECESVDGRGQSTPTVYQLPEPQRAINIPDNAHFDLILGMNILGKCDFRIDRNGQFVIEIPDGAFAT